MAFQPQIVGSLPSTAAQGLVNAWYPPPEDQTEALRGSKGELEGLITELSEALRETAQNIPALTAEDAIVLPQNVEPRIREIWDRAKQLIEQRAIAHFLHWTQNMEQYNLIGSVQEVVGTLAEPLPPDLYPQYRVEIRGFKNYIEDLLIPPAAKVFAEQRLGMAIVWNAQQLTHEEWYAQVGRHPVGNLQIGYDRYLLGAFATYIQPHLIDPVQLFNQFQAQPDNPHNNQGN